MPSICADGAYATLCPKTNQGLSATEGTAKFRSLVRISGVFRLLVGDADKKSMENVESFHGGRRHCCETIRRASGTTAD